MLSTFVSYLMFVLCACIVAESRSIAPRNTNSSRITSIFAFGDSYTDNGSFSDFYKSNVDEVDPRRYSLHIQEEPYILTSVCKTQLENCYFTQGKVHTLRCH